MSMFQCEKMDLFSVLVQCGYVLERLGKIIFFPMFSSKRKVEGNFLINCNKIEPYQAALPSKWKLDLPHKLPLSPITFPKLFLSCFVLISIT